MSSIVSKQKKRVKMKLIDFLNLKFAINRKTKTKYSMIVKRLTEEQKKNINMELS